MIESRSTPGRRQWLQIHSWHLSRRNRRRGEVRSGVEQGIVMRRVRMEVLSRVGVGMMVESTLDRGDGVMKVERIVMRGEGGVMTETQIDIVLDHGLVLILDLTLPSPVVEDIDCQQRGADPERNPNLAAHLQLVHLRLLLHSRLTTMIWLATSTRRSPTVLRSDQFMRPSTRLPPNLDSIFPSSVPPTKLSRNTRTVQHRLRTQLWMR